MRLMPLISVAIALVLAGLGWRTHVLNQQLTHAQQVIGTLSAGIEDRDKAITRLQNDARQLAKQETALRLSLGAASQLSLSREQKIQRLLNENKALRDWYIATLPADVIRLHQRPTFDNAGDYLRWLSERQQLPNTSQ